MMSIEIYGLIIWLLEHVDGFFDPLSTMFIANDRSTATAFSLLMAGTVSSSQSTLLTDQLTDKLCNQSLKVPLPHPAMAQQCRWKCPQESCAAIVFPAFAISSKLPDITTPKKIQGKPQQLCLRIFAEAREAGAASPWSCEVITATRRGWKKREQQHITQCAPQSGASVLQGNFPMTGHTGLKFAKACESYFSSIIVIEGYLKDNRIIVERYLYKRQQKRENQITSNNGNEKKKKTNKSKIKFPKKYLKFHWAKQRRVVIVLPETPGAQRVIMPHH